MDISNFYWRHLLSSHIVKMTSCENESAVKTAVKKLQNLHVGKRHQHGHWTIDLRKDFVNRAIEHWRPRPYCSSELRCHHHSWTQWKNAFNIFLLVRSTTVHECLIRLSVCGSCAGRPRPSETKLSYGFCETLVEIANCAAVRTAAYP